MFRVQGLGLPGLGFRVRVQGLGFRVEGVTGIQGFRLHMDSVAPERSIRGSFFRVPQTRQMFAGCAVCP